MRSWFASAAAAGTSTHSVRALYHLILLQPMRLRNGACVREVGQTLDTSDLALAAWLVRCGKAEPAEQTTSTAVQLFDAFDRSD
jgi:hypothetical protein